MKGTVSHDVKRKIDSKIFELQSSLLEEGVTEALLRECTLWFRPKHLEDIITERSEAEGLCGWPGCRKSLPSWGLAAPRVFEAADGEDSGRFCTRACMMRTRVLVSAIPSTPPYSREHVLRVACPSLFEKSPIEASRSNANAAGAKKIYKRARRRDIPPKAAKPADSSNGATPVSETSLSKETLPDETGASCTSRTALPLEVTARASCPAAKEDFEAGQCTVAKSIETAAQLSTGRKAERSRENTNGDGVGCIQDRLALVSIASSDSGRDVPLTAMALTEVISRPPVAEDSGPSVASSSPAEKPPVPAVDYAPVVRSDWAGTRLGPKSGAGSTVSLHATLVAEAAAANPAVADLGPSGVPPPENSPKDSPVTTSMEPEAPVAINSGSRDNEAEEEAITSSTTEEPSSESQPRSKRGVSFAEGTKESRPDSAALAPSTAAAASIPRVSTRARARGLAGVDGQGQRRSRGKNGSTKGLGAAKARGVVAMQTSVVGEVMEKPPAVPSPMMQQPAGGRDAAAAAGRTGSGVATRAGLIEGHLPRVQADLSFRVMPRGYQLTKEDEAGFAARELAEKRTGAPEEFGLKQQQQKQQEEEENVESQSVASGETDGEDDEENDRAIWRETFGEEMPDNLAQGSWIDMDAVHDKAMREEFASSIGAFPLLWDAVSEWVTPATRAVCRAGRAAAAAAAAASRATSEIETEPVIGNMDTQEENAKEELSKPQESGSLHDIKEPSATWSRDAETKKASCHNVQARKSGAVAEAIELEARRHARGDKPSARAGVSGDFAGVTLTGALRHSGVSAMINMHLSQAERALRAASGGGATPVDPKGAIESRTFVWSDTRATSPDVKLLTARQGQWIEAGWLEETKDAVKHTLGKEHQGKNEADYEEIGRERVAKTKGELIERGGGGAACRRAVAAVIDTLDAARAAGAANLSIAQWKVVPVVLLTAIGLGGSGRGEAGTTVSGHEAGETAVGTEACANLCGPQMSVSAREFEMLVEVFLED